MFQIPYSRHSFSAGLQRLGGTFRRRRRPHLVLDEDAAAALALQGGESAADSQALAVSCTSCSASGLSNTLEQVDDRPGSGRPVGWTVDGPSNMPRRVCSSSFDQRDPQRRQRRVQFGLGDSSDRCSWRAQLGGQVAEQAGELDAASRAGRRGGRRRGASTAIARIACSTTLRSRRRTDADHPDQQRLAGQDAGLAVTGSGVERVEPVAAAGLQLDAWASPAPPTAARTRPSGRRWR